MMEVPSLQAFLDAATSTTTFPAHPSFVGYGGQHGGFTLGLVVQSMQAAHPERRVRRVTGEFHRPVRGVFELTSETRHEGREAVFVRTDVRDSGRLAVSATGLFTGARELAERPVVEPAPAAPPPHACAPLDAPPTLRPFTDRTDLRPVGPTRPYAAGPEAELLAWLRWTEDDRPVDVARLVFLMDMLAPSYAAVLDAPVAIPTVSYDVTPGDGLGRDDSPWILLRARTTVASADGWMHERLDAWSEGGVHLGTGAQVRMLRRAAA